MELFICLFIQLFSQLVSQFGTRRLFMNIEPCDSPLIRYTNEELKFVQQGQSQESQVCSRSCGVWTSLRNFMSNKMQIIPRRFWGTQHVSWRLQCLRYSLEEYNTWVSDFSLQIVHSNIQVNLRQKKIFFCVFINISVLTHHYSNRLRFLVTGVEKERFYTGLFISPSGISELDCATTKTDTAERSISIGRESL